MDINKIYEIEIKKPYNDWAAANALGRDMEFGDGLTVRYRAINDIGTEKPKAAARDKENWARPVEVPDLKNTSLLTLTEVRQLVSFEYAKTIMTKFPRSGKYISDNTGIDNSFNSKFIRSAKDSEYIEDEVLPDGTVRLPHMSSECRPFSIPLIQIGPVADFVMKSSIHEMFFGDEGSIVLTKYNRNIVSALEKMSDSELAATYELCKSLYNTHVKRYRDNLPDGAADLSNFGQTKPIAKLLYDRVHEASYENKNISGARYIVSETAKGPESLKVALKKIGSEDNLTTDKAFEPHVELFMFLDNESELLPMDYFLRNDYINIEGGFSPNGTAKPRLRIYTLSDNGDKIEVTNPDILRILSFSIGLDGDEKVVLDGHIFSIGMLSYMPKLEVKSEIGVDYFPNIILP